MTNTHCDPMRIMKHRDISFVDTQQKSKALLMTILLFGGSRCLWKSATTPLQNLNIALEE